MVAYDSDTNTFEDMGDWMPGDEKHAKGETRSGVFAMEFDNDGMRYSVEIAAAGFVRLGCPPPCSAGILPEEGNRSGWGLLEPRSGLAAGLVKSALARMI